MSEAIQKMTLREFRRAGARAFFSRVWFARAMCVTAILSALQVAVAFGFEWARQHRGFMSWSDFAQAKARALASGLDLTVPSRQVAFDMTAASAFELFMTLIVAGITAYGCAAFALRMVRNERDCGFLAGALGGFARPLGVAWLFFRMQVQIALWLLLLFVPGVVAFYRYRAAWYLKAQNPDWGAGRCLAESARIMYGHKRRCFALDCTYWLTLSVAMILVIVAAAFFLPAASSISLLAVTIIYWYVHAGQTIFYLSILNDTNTTNTETANI